jgi:hypothetical protein
MCRGPSNLSANTVAQNPGGSVMPPFRASQPAGGVSSSGGFAELLLGGSAHCAATAKSMHHNARRLLLLVEESIRDLCESPSLDRIAVAVSGDSPGTTNGLTAWHKRHRREFGISLCRQFYEREARPGRCAPKKKCGPRRRHLRVWKLTFSISN